MTYVNAQKLNRRITIERKATTQDTWGQPSTSWVEVASVHAQVKFITGAGFVGQEFFSGGLEVSRPIASFRIRKRDGIDAGMRISYDGRYYDIKVVLPDEQDRRHIDLGVATGANNG